MSPINPLPSRDRQGAMLPRAAKLVIVLGCSTLLTPAAFPQISSFTLESKENSIIFTFNTPRGAPGSAITGAPFSADEITEHVKTLADGTHVSQTPRTQHIVRDSQGRTRTERSLYAVPTPNARSISVTEIRDPVDGLYYILDDQAKVAHRFSTTKPTPQPAVTRLPASPPVQAVTPSKPASDSNHPERSLEKLGSQWIEGVMAEGLRDSITWPIGAQGNDRPIVTVFESWFSRDLQMDVRRKTSDPRNGDTTMRLTNLTRAEPDPALLQPPQDYTIVDEKGPFTITIAKQ